MDNIKKFEDFLDRMQGLLNNAKKQGHIIVRVEDLENAFPELKENYSPELKESDKIRKVLVDYFKSYKEQEECGIKTFYGIPTDNIIAWLEKQGNINPTEDELKALRIAAYEPTKNWSEKLQSLYEKLTNCEQNEQKPVIEMKTPEESLGIDSDTYNKIVDECIFGEQKPTDVEEVNFFDDFRKTDSEVEPKFHEGEWITNGDYTWQIVEIKPLDYILQSQDDNVVDDTISHVDEQFHSFTIQDAKDGDVLTTDTWAFIFKKNQDKSVYYHCAASAFNDFSISDTGEFDSNYVHPATKEQRDFLFQKMKESGYEWDSEKLELIKIKQNVTSKFKVGDNIEPIDNCLGSTRTIYKICDGWYETNHGTLNFEFENNWRLIEQKPAWSEEDERIRHSLIIDLSNAQTDDEKVQNEINEEINWLKSIKDRVLPQSKQKWSEEDEVKMNRIVACLENLNVADNDILLKDVAWLKSLRPQNTWRPSDEQIGVIEAVINNRSFQRRHLDSLYEQLKKLREA